MSVFIDSLVDILVLLYKLTLWFIKMVAEGLYLLFRFGGWIGETLAGGLGNSASSGRGLAKGGKRKPHKHRNAKMPFGWGNQGSSPSTPQVDASTWSLPLLRAFEWKRYEEVVAHYYSALGYTSKVTRMGADGGVDVVLYQQGNPQPAIIVQCKAWSKNVGVKAVRELFGVMAADCIGYGIFATTSDYTKEAYDFAQGRPMELMSGQGFMEKVRALTTEQQQCLLERATEGDFTTPTCPNCNVKMTSRESKKGANAGSRFWGCPTYPKCRQTFKID